MPPSLNVRSIHDVRALFRIENAVKRSERTRGQGHVNGAGANGGDLRHVVVVQPPKEARRLTKSASKHDNIALERSTVFKNHAARFNRFHGAVGLDQHPHFIKRRCHSTHQPGPTFPDHAQSLA